jgi:hypothetical protein
MSEVADFEESLDAADGEEITNKIPMIEGVSGRLNADRRPHQMCLIQADFKHFAHHKRKNFENAARSRQSCEPRSCQS